MSVFFQALLSLTHRILRLRRFVLISLSDLKIAYMPATKCVHVSFQKLFDSTELFCPPLSSRSLLSRARYALNMRNEKRLPAEHNIDCSSRTLGPKAGCSLTVHPAADGCLVVIMPNYADGSG